MYTTFPRDVYGASEHAWMPCIDATTPIWPKGGMSLGFRCCACSMRHVAQVFDSIPETVFGYKPTPAQLSIGYIAQHVAEDNYLFCNALGNMKADVPADEAGTPDSVKATWPKATLVKQLRAGLASAASATPPGCRP